VIVLNPETQTATIKGKAIKYANIRISDLMTPITKIKAKKCS